MAHLHKLARIPGIIQMNTTLERTYYRPHMAADVTSVVRNWVHCAENRVRLRKRAMPLKLFPAFDLQDSVTTDILGPLSKTQCGVQYTAMIVEWVANLVKVMSLSSIRSIDVAQSFLEH